jgi:hypothetical protein
MNKSSSLSQSTRSCAAPYGAAIYTHPSDVTSNPKLTTAEKRAILASWISNARAVENAPSLCQLDSGAVVEVDAISAGAGFARSTGARPQRERPAAAPLGPKS